MAIEKPVTLPGGVTGNYWKIISTRTDHLTGMTRAILGLYKDADQRAKTPNEYIHTAKFTLLGADEPTRADIYTRMRESQKDGDGHETNEWADAKDIIEPIKDNLEVK